jgi:hypothetical protein
MGEIFVNDDQIEDWVDAALGIKERYGIEKALGYVIGEKFYNLVSSLHASRIMIRLIDEGRQKSDYNPIREKTYGNRKYTENFDDTYEREKKIIIEAEGLLVKFAFLIHQVFEPYEIRKYFESYPRLGVHGHVATDEQYEFMVSKGAIEHSIETEVQDALILGDMLKYFQIS